MKLITYPNKLLRMISEPVENFDREIENLSNLMLSSLKTFNGVGLSAVQIGKLLRIFVIDTRQPQEKKVFINPQIIATSQDNIEYDEGCLSIPSFFAMIKRPSQVTIQAQDVDGKPFTLHATGLFARAIQHEADHLDGKLYIDHLDEKKQKSLLRQYYKEFNIKRKI